ncbi:MAG: hypothetical protein V1918_06430 [Planctomycetota bacterium]
MKSQKRGFEPVPIQDSRDPKKQITAYVDTTTFRKLANRNPTKAQNLKIALEVLQNPVSIWHGLREHETPQSGYCYAGKPENVFYRTERNALGNQVPLRKKWLFCVFLNEDMKIFDWGLLPVSPEHELWPEGHRERFQERLWTL